MGVPNMLVIDVMTKNELPPSRKLRHDCRKEPNGGAQAQYSADWPFGDRDGGSSFLVITSITSKLGTPTPAGFATRKPRAVSYTHLTLPTKLAV